MSMRRFRVEKLIRDNLPNLMREKGIVVDERYMEDAECILRLKEKLIEEAREAAESSCEQELVEELADILEVIKALAYIRGIDIEQIEAKRVAKRKEKGGFDKKIYNRYVDIEEGNPSIDYYLNKQEQYPPMGEG